jgi:hypothetical protein
MNFVEWDGILYAFDYAFNLHVLIVRLANNRIEKCEKQAKFMTLNRIDEVNSDTQHCFPVDIIVDKKPVLDAFEVSSERCTLPNLSLFDSLKIIKEFVPGLGLMSCGIFGIRAYSASTKSLKVTKVSFSIIVLAGCF